MKPTRILALILAVVCLCPMLFACEKKGNTTTTTTAASQTVKLGLGVSASQTANKAEFDLTVCAVTVDKDGKIVDIALDVLQLKGTVGADGTVTPPASYPTKYERGSEYGMQGASAIGKEWNEQADAFCAFVIGKTAAQVTGLVAENGKANDDTLKASCSISIDAFAEATVKAINNATYVCEVGTDLAVAMVTEEKSASATATAAGKYAVDVTIAAVAEKNSTVAAVFTDVIQLSAAVAADGTVSPATTKSLKTKMEQGSEYGMKGSSAIGKEWYEQNAAFCAFAVDKNAAGLTGLVAENGKANDDTLKASCSVTISELVAATVKALQK